MQVLISQNMSAEFHVAHMVGIAHAQIGYKGQIHDVLRASTSTVKPAGNP
jgi:hypothetical protein